MLKSPRISSRGFTLIELLVVLAIIAILAGLSFAGISAAMQAAKKAQAGAMVNQVKTALTAYQTEYGRWPGLFGTSDTEVESSNSELYNILIGSSTTVSSNQNPRRIVFMEFNTKDLDNPSSPGGFLDPWKKTYHLKVDSDYNNEITGLPIKKAGDPTKINGSIAIWSYGTKESTIPSPDKDLVTTW
jgi:prepilin-type N-terminal cleavage/methylation domain-containing protein